MMTAPNGCGAVGKGRERASDRKVAAWRTLNTRAGKKAASIQASEVVRAWVGSLAIARVRGMIDEKSPYDFYHRGIGQILNFL